MTYFIKNSILKSMCYIFRNSASREMSGIGRGRGRGRGVFRRDDTGKPGDAVSTPKRCNGLLSGDN